MSPIEITILVILLLMVVPDLCAKVGRPGLTYLVYLFAGFLLGPTLDDSAKSLLTSVSGFGFILLLFGIGLEIDLPSPSQMTRSLRIGGAMFAVQYLVCAVLGVSVGLSWPEACLASGALTGSSLGLVKGALNRYSGPTAEERADLLHLILVIETVSMVLLSGADVLLQHGLGLRFVLRLLGIACAILLVATLSRHLTAWIHGVVERSVEWKAHIVALFVLLAAAMGERLGLSSAKTAFFLGLFAEGATDEGDVLQRHLAPIGHRLLIPVFLVAVGLNVPLAMLASRVSLLGLLSAVFLLALRALAFRWMVCPVQDRRHLLLGPNLTLVAIAAHSLGVNPQYRLALEWVLLHIYFALVISG